MSTEIAQKVLVEVDGVEWCSVHCGVRNEDDADGCDMCNVDSEECEFHVMFYAPNGESVERLRQVIARGLAVEAEADQRRVEHVLLSPYEEGYAAGNNEAVDRLMAAGDEQS